MVKAFSEVSGREIPYELVDRRPGDVASCYASCELAATELGWRSKLSLEDMCKYILKNSVVYIYVVLTKSVFLKSMQFLYHTTFFIEVIFIPRITHKG